METGRRRGTECDKGKNKDGVKERRERVEAGNRDGWKRKIGRKRNM